MPYIHERFKRRLRYTYRSHLLHDNRPCHPRMIIACIVKLARCLESETKSATRGEVPAIKRPIVTGNCVGNR
jgi:hypothetical protein